jgi:hypothetical protein
LTPKEWPSQTRKSPVALTRGKDKPTSRVKGKRVSRGKTLGSRPETSTEQSGSKWGPHHSRLRTHTPPTSLYSATPTSSTTPKTDLSFEPLSHPFPSSSPCLRSPLKHSTLRVPAPVALPTCSLDPVCLVTTAQTSQGPLPSLRQTEGGQALRSRPWLDTAPTPSGQQTLLLPHCSRLFSRVTLGPCRHHRGAEQECRDKESAPQASDEASDGTYGALLGAPRQPVTVGKLTSSQDRARVSKGQRLQ